MAARAYVCDTSGAATSTIQVQGTQTFTECTFTVANVAAGKCEVSLASTSQIGTAQPDSNVLARFNIAAGGATGPTSFAQCKLNQPVKAFQSIYVHQTGAANLGTVILR
jgi:hypothetical protein